jgi:CRP/FNR family transcriptional regulator, anaerobic regulatory protein
MFVDCRNCAVRTKAVFRPMSEGELTFVRSLKADQIEFPAREHIVREGENGGRLYTLFSGWAYRYKMLGSDRRQVLDFLLPGDLIGLQSPLTGRVRHSVCSVTPVSVCVLNGQPFATIFEGQPALASSLVQTLMIEEDRADTRLLLLGRQRPTERLGYLLVELRERLMQRGMSDGRSCPMPLTYEQMADAVGVSRAQVAGSLKELRERGWFAVSRGRAVFGDVTALATECGFTGASEVPLRAIV